ncbi:zinc finger BED domain-containing protein RICESLEEPER 2-like [Cicer arietinum]|uniref:Zinc finger BED domain-containing protein RICESLEEPER 2-like n=1 Tax=Cicer arietinum TaxID=3827 RepID=A0A1S3EI82_CICAR|nr:zinc finger BED domain-containing protein RICESLEEPER 2-like [Cicer arietinum]
MAKCHYCGNLIEFKDETSAMTMHLKRCKEHPDNQELKRQKTQRDELGVVSSPHSTFDQEACQLELVKMFVGAELPFQFVENVFFRNFVNVLQPQFDIPPRCTLRRAICSLFHAERESLKILISKHRGRVCLTTDTWTSIQNLSYMNLTAHFIDKKWNLHKRILNFCKITSHTEEFMAKEVETCLNAWELNRVFSITIENASSNDVEIKFMKKWMNARNCLLLNGESIHMWCCAHILSLIVKEGLKDEDISITRIRKAVKYVRLSPSRLARFKGCVERENFFYKEIVDAKYVKELSKDKGHGVPLSKDWDFANMVLPFLKIFYMLLCVSTMMQA